MKLFGCVFNSKYEKGTPLTFNCLIAQSRSFSCTGIEQR